MTAPDLEPLREWLFAHPDPHEIVAEQGGGQVHVGRDGVRTMTMPYPIYTPTIAAFWTALEASGWTVEDTKHYSKVVDDWTRCHGVAATDPAHFARLDRKTLANVLRWHDRGERFCDGTWRSAFANGVMHTGARAVLALGGLTPAAGFGDTPVP